MSKKYVLTLRMLGPTRLKLRLPSWMCDPPSRMSRLAACTFGLPTLKSAPTPRMPRLFIRAVVLPPAALAPTSRASALNPLMPGTAALT